MVGVTPQIMQQGMRTDYKLVEPAKLTSCASGCWRRGNANGKNRSRNKICGATFDRNLDWVKTSGLISPRYWSNLPAGEVFTTPASVDGTFVCDATAGDYFNGKYGDLQSTPMKLTIEGGRLVRVECAR